jgi:translation initiation factor IF-2
MEQVRVNELASEFEMRSTAVILELKKIGVWVPSPETPVDFDIANRIRRRLQLVIDTEQEEQARAVKAKVRKRPAAKARKTIKQLGQPRKAASPSAETIDSPFLMGSLRPRKGKGNYRRIVTEPPEAVLEKTEVTIEDEPIIERVEAQISAELLEQAQRMILSTQAPVASSSLPLVPPGTAGPVVPPPVPVPPAAEDAVKPAADEAPAPELPEAAVEVTAAAEVETPVAEAPEAEPQPAEVVKEPEGPAVITVSDSVTVRDLSEKLGVKSKVLIKELFSRGVMATINRSLDRDTIQQLCDIFDAQVEFVSEQEALVQEEHVVERPEDVQARAPVVTVMGHVDHGKTSLLDAIRESRVAASEAGGITQHIGAYHVSVDDHKIVFLDTPGHEAFTLMRARGAQVTDIVVLVVAADDGVMPQTLEAMDHAKAAGVPIVVAVNKMDRPDARPDRVKQQLADRGLTPEDWGGDTVMVEVSALAQTNLDLLLEMILLVADLTERTANPQKPAVAVVLEAQLDRGRGPVATALIQDGTLRVGDSFVAGTAYGKVRAMFDDRGQPVVEAGPSSAVEVLGLHDLPQAGDSFQVLASAAKSRDIAGQRRQEQRRKDLARSGPMGLEKLFAQMATKEVKELDLIIKADGRGSVEVLEGSLRKLSGEKVRIKIVHSGVGAISESDVLLAAASRALVVGFNVRPERNAQMTAEREQVELRMYTVIYELIEEIQQAMLGLLEPTIRERLVGRAEVRDTFRVAKFGTIAGCFILDGSVARNSMIRLVRDGAVIHEGRTASLRRFRDDVNEVRSGYECGISIANYQDIKVGDVIEAFVKESVAPQLV